MIDEKKFYQSRTFWFNVVAFIVAVLANFGYTGELSGDLGQFVLPVVFMINLILRFVTNKKLTL